MFPIRMYPLRFKPIFRRYLWGGQRLSALLKKATGPLDAAESWEIVDHQDDQSIVTHGSLAGKTLRELIADSGPQLLGASYDEITHPTLPAHLQGRFPLLFKFLDANQALSVQVHPDDRYGATLSPPDLGKTEAWYVLHAQPGARIFAGLKSGVTAAEFQAAIANGETQATLHSFEPQVGDCVFIPAGTVHALGAGLVIAEIQQASNTTFRVYDWDRVDDQGNARPLHIEQAIEVTNFERGPVNPTRGTAIPEGGSNLVSCDKFVLNKRKITAPTTIAGDGKFHLLAITTGELSIESDPCPRPLQFADTVLLPASMPAIEITPGQHGAEFLEIHLERH